MDTRRSSVLPLQGSEGTGLMGHPPDDAQSSSATADSVRPAEVDLASAESEAYFRALAESTADVVFRGTNEALLSWISPSVGNVLGWEPAELVGHSALDLLHPDDRDTLQRASSHVNSGDRQEYEARFRTREGSYRWMSVSVGPVIGSTGEVDGRIGRWRDIQQEVDLRNQLQASEEWFRLLAENASDVVLLVDATNNCVWASPSIEQALGWSPDDVIGRSSDELIHPDDLTHALEYRTRMLSGESLTLEVRLRTADGSYVWMAGSTRPMTGRDGQDFGRVISLRDIDAQVQARNELAAREEQYRLLADNTSDFVLRTDLDGIIQWITDSVDDVLGWPGLGLLGQSAYNFIDPRDEAAVREFEAALRRGMPIEADLRVRHATDGYRWMRWRARPIVDSAGVVVAAVHGCRDIHIETRARQELEASERHYRLLAENASDIVLVASLDGTCQWVSDSISQVLGWLPTEVIGQPARPFIHPDDAERIFALRSADAPGQRLRSECRIRSRDGTYRWFAWTTHSMSDDSGSVVGVIGSMIDISALKAVEAELTFSATHDPLTGLANRTLLGEHMRHALQSAEGRSSALLMIDLNHFKAVNDSLGHAVGDLMLQAVAQRVAAAVGPDDLVARHGGDQIFVFTQLEGTEPAADALAQRIIGKFREPIILSGAELYATLSIGIAIAPPVTPPRSTQDLMREADAAMYAAKATRHQQVAIFTEDMQQAAQDRIRLETDMRNAITRGELEVWYQPEVDLTTEAVTAVEALLRWRRPDGTVRAASHFIGLAEDTGMILEIGASVISRVVRQAATWQFDPSLDGLVTRVNLSPHQLMRPGLAEMIADELAAAGTCSSRLCIEITESTLLRDSNTVRTNLLSLHDQGIALAIDDFGTGYAAMTYLSRYPIDVIKIDQSFVRRLMDSDRDRRVVAGLIALADQLGVHATAEGVETPEQADLLRAMNCPSAQGYWFSPAIEHQEIAAFSRSRRRATGVSGVMEPRQ